MADKNKVEVKIAGKEYTLKGVESDEYMQKVALYIDRKMNEILKVNNRLSTSMAAVLTAVNVADDFFKVQSSESQAKDELKTVKSELEKLKQENLRLRNNNSELSRKESDLKLELAKREAELNEVRNSISRANREINGDEE